MDNLVSILHTKDLNYEVKNKMLRLIQNWSVAFEGKYTLGYVGQVYKELKSSGEFMVLYYVKLSLTYFNGRVLVPTKRPNRCQFCHDRYINGSRMDRF